MEAEVDNPGHRNEHMIIHAKEMPEIQSDKHRSTDPVTSGTNTIMRTKKLQWGPPVLPTAFVECKYPKYLSYLTINRNMMDRKNPSHGYLQAAKILGGSKATTMQSLQLHLMAAAQSWLGKLHSGSIDSWYELEKQFVSNFRSTYKRPASIEELKACIQGYNEPLRSYIQRWSIIKNSTEDVSDKRAVDAFVSRLRRPQFIEEMGRLKPRRVSELMDIANKFADGKDTYNNKRTRSPGHDHSNHYNNQKRKPRNYEEYSLHNQVDAGYMSSSSKQGEEHQNSGYHNDNRDESRPSKSMSNSTRKGVKPLK
jgi:hypothetical protein